MLFKDIAFLISITSGENDMGDPIEIEGKPRQIFVNEKSVKMAEFYQAVATGFRPEIVLETKAVDYLREKKIIFEENSYRIIRTYKKGIDEIELICEGWVNSATT